MSLRTKLRQAVIFKDTDRPKQTSLTNKDGSIAHCRNPPSMPPSDVRDIAQSLTHELNIRKKSKSTCKMFGICRILLPHPHRDTLSTVPPPLATTRPPLDLGVDWMLAYITPVPHATSFASHRREQLLAEGMGEHALTEGLDNLSFFSPIS
ncbi:hypothetical protein BV22DRAFT_1131075 [Leucogyrophana mollusca]|uniref:Uncharacterized protein n=1 Tax=Leucogyrophana mollusca TaxID=85980 RepID=A0ACB8BAR8_9AGAM|nr:hypothetical protein BV22DRAFT_1131075 [Leucogyrophana mollusca]